MYRTYNFIKANFYRLYKELIEYKANFYSLIIIELFLLFTIIILSEILINNLNVIPNWNQGDFILLYTLTSMAMSGAGIVNWRGFFSTYLLEGEFNNYLTKPINVFNQFIFINLNSVAVISFIIAIFSFTGTVIYFNIELYHLFFSFIILLLVIFFSISQRLFFDSFDFFIKDLSKISLRIIGESNNIMERFPAPFFKKFSFYPFLFLLSNFYIGIIILPILRNYDSNYVFVLPILLFLIVVFVFTTHFMWKKGLQKYEAFG